MDCEVPPAGFAPATAGRAPAIAPGMPGVEAFARLLAHGAADAAAALEPALALEIEGIHDMRVSLRRMRAPLALFRPCLGTAAAGFDERLRHAGRLFGRVRDWDVLLTESLPDARKAGMSDVQANLLADAIATPRRAAQLAVGQEFTDNFAALLPAVGSWAADGAQAPVLLGDADRLQRPVAELVPALVKRLARRTAKRAKGHRHAAPEALHKLRKRTKTLRYAADALAPLYGERAVKPLVKHAKALQDTLGRVNDAAAIPRLLAPLASGPGSELDAAIRELCAWAERRGTQARRQVSRRWHDLRDTRPFWA